MYRIKCTELKKNPVLKSRNRYSQKRPDQSKAKTQQGKCNVLQFYVVALGVLVDICCATSLGALPSRYAVSIHVISFLAELHLASAAFLGRFPTVMGIFSKLETSSKLMLHLHSFIQWPSRTSMQET